MQKTIIKQKVRREGKRKKISCENSKVNFMKIIYVKERLFLHVLLKMYFPELKLLSVARTPKKNVENKMQMLKHIPKLRKFLIKHL